MKKKITNEAYKIVYDIFVVEIYNCIDPIYKRKLVKTLKNIENVYLASGYDTDIMPL